MFAVKVVDNEALMKIIVVHYVEMFALHNSALLKNTLESMS